MAENELYSAYHWAKKAEKVAERAKEISEALDVVDITQCLRRSGEEVFQDGTFTIKGDNLPLVIESMAGTTTGLQVKDSLGAGETDLEHYATGDRYGSRLVNRTSTGAEGTLDLYTTTAGVSILDATDLSSVLVPTPGASDASNRAASTEFVTNALQAKANADGSNFTTEAKETFVGWCMPDYKAGVSFSSGSTAAYDGFIVFISSGGGGFQHPSVAVDGVTVYAAANLDGTVWSGILPVRKGSVVSYSSMSNVKLYPLSKF